MCKEDPHARHKRKPKDKTMEILNLLFFILDLLRFN